MLHWNIPKVITLKCHKDVTLRCPEDVTSWNVLKTLHWNVSKMFQREIAMTWWAFLTSREVWRLCDVSKVTLIPSCKVAERFHAGWVSYLHTKNDSECHSHMFTRLIFQKCLPPAVKEGSNLQTKNDSDCHSHMFTRPIFFKCSPPAV